MFARASLLATFNFIEAYLNGIAYDSQGDRLFVTGKLWPKLFEIKVVPLHRKSR